MRGRSGQNDTHHSTLSAGSYLFNERAVFVPQNLREKQGRLQKGIGDEG